MEKENQSLTNAEETSYDKCFYVFIGQDNIKSKLNFYIESAKKNRCFFGPYTFLRTAWFGKNYSRSNYSE